MADERPIGLFDSGVGGLTVALEVFRALPRESIIYFADSGRFPYGGRPHSEIREIAGGLTAYLVQQSVKAIIVACNTSTSVALDLLQLRFPVPIVGVIAPGSRVAAAATRNKQVGVIATAGTVLSGAYVRALHQADPALAVFQQGCPRLTELVEGGQLAGEETEGILRSYLEPLQAEAVDTLVLGCTHFPFLRAGIAKIMGEEVALIDPAAATVREMQDILHRQGMLAVGAGPAHRYIASQDPEHFRDLGSRLLGSPIRQVELVTPAELPVITKAVI